MSAWTVTALQRLKALLEDDARLSLYVDVVAVAARLRSTDLPDVTRHGILLAPGPKVDEPNSCGANLERFAIRMRLVLVGWTDDEETLLTANDTSGGVGSNGSGGSEVGMLTWIEDVQNACRLTRLPDGLGNGLIEPTAVEVPGVEDMSIVRAPAWDRLFLVQDLVFNAQTQGYHALALR